MKNKKSLIGISLLSLVFAACQKDDRFASDKSNPSKDTETTATAARGRHGHESGTGYVYTLSNQTDGNKVLVYRRAADGMLSWLNSYSTGGEGTGGGLGNQGAVILGDEGKILLAVNPGSNSISSFTVNSYGLKLKSTVHSGGMKPISITRHNHLVYVLNAGGNGNIAGYWLGYGGWLYPIPHSKRPLSSNAADPAQIEFVNNGKALAITEKATNKITSYTINRWGLPGAMHTLTSANPTPFGFAPGRHGNIFVSEAAGGAPGASTLSSYRIADDGSISLIEGPVGANQSAACWVVLTDNGKYAFATNTGSNNISTFAVNSSTGSISVHEAISGTTEPAPIDAALSNKSKFLYTLNSGGNSISAFAVAGDGSLTSVQVVSGLPQGATGLAAK